MKPMFGPAPVRPFPHVEGQTRRIKAEPTKLTGLAVRVMAASGNFSTRRTVSPAFPSLWLGAGAALLVAAAIAVAGNDARTGDRTGTALAALPPAAAPAPAAAADTQPAAPAPSAVATREAKEPAPEALDAQDRFEVQRFFRLAADSASALAPAGGPAPR